jgi:hypothetical protein
LLAACSSGPIEWEDTVHTIRTVSGRDTLGRVYRDTTLGPLPPVTPGQCASSVRTWWNQGSPVVNAVWWSLRADQSADLVTATARDGRTWSAPIRVDTADVGKSGCDRPPPAIYGDGANVHIVYSMRAREGPGIFLTHSMDGGALYHSPVAVVYGEKPGLASIGARGNFVVVAYEDPNTNPTRISVAISTTMAHLFDFREIVSPPGESVAKPSVLVDSSGVMVSWVRAAEPSVHFARLGARR